MTSDGLTVGECTSCGHISGGDPQFCEICGESLLVPCYSCKEEIKPWVKFCAGCGQDIPLLLYQRLGELEEQQRQVQTLRGEYRHAEALELLGGMVIEGHPRFAAIREWAQDRETGLRTELQELEERKDLACRDADQAFESHDYGEVVRLLEPLPTSVLDESTRELLADAKQKDERCTALFSTIRKAVKEKRKDGLLELVKEYRALKPQDTRLASLYEQLTRRHVRLRLGKLESHIREKVSGKQLDGLLPFVEEFLELRPADERMQKLSRKLQVHEDRLAAERASRRRKRRLLRLGVGSGAAVLLLFVIGLAWTAWQEVASQWKAGDRLVLQVAAEQKAAEQKAAEQKAAEQKAAEQKAAEQKAAEQKAAEQKAAEQKAAVEKVAAEKDAMEKAAADKAAMEKAAADKAAMEKAAKIGATKKLVEDRKPLTFTGHTAHVSHVRFSPDGKRIVSCGGSLREPGEIKVWDAQTGKETLSHRLPLGGSFRISCMSSSPDGKRIVSGGSSRANGMLKVWDAQTGQETLTLKGHSHSVTSVSFSPDGKRIVSGSYQTLKVWDAQTGRETLTLKGQHSDSVTSVSFSPDGKRIVSRGGNGMLKVWDAQTGHETLTLNYSRGSTSVSFSPDGKRIVSSSIPVTGGFDNTIIVWDAQTGKTTLTLRGRRRQHHPGTGHSGFVTMVSFSPDGKRIVSGSNDKTIKVWDAQTGQETLTLEGHEYAVTMVSFSPDGKRIVSGGEGGTVKVWNISPLATSK
jgi:Tol biopolymer transport system component